MSRKKLQISVDCGNIIGIKVQNHYAEYDSDKKEVRGAGKCSAHRYASLPFEPSFEAILFDKWRRIHSTVVVTYNGVFRETGRMYFTFKFSGIEPDDAKSVKLSLIAIKGK